MIHSHPHFKHSKTWDSKNTPSLNSLLTPKASLDLNLHSFAQLHSNTFSITTVTSNMSDSRDIQFKDHVEGLPQGFFDELLSQLSPTIIKHLAQTLLSLLQTPPNRPILSATPDDFEASAEMLMFVVSGIDEITPSSFHDCYLTHLLVFSQHLSHISSLHIDFAALLSMSRDRLEVLSSRIMLGSRPVTSNGVLSSPIILLPSLASNETLSSSIRLNKIRILPREPPSSNEIPSPPLTFPQSNATLLSPSPQLTSHQTQSNPFSKPPHLAENSINIFTPGNHHEKNVNIFAPLTINHCEENLFAPLTSSHYEVTTPSTSHNHYEEKLTTPMLTPSPSDHLEEKLFISLSNALSKMTNLKELTLEAFQQSTHLHIQPNDLTLQRTNHSKPINMTSNYHSSSISNNQNSSTSNHRNNSSNPNSNITLDLTNSIITTFDYSNSTTNTPNYPHNITKAQKHHNIGNLCALFPPHFSLLSLRSLHISKSCITSEGYSYLAQNVLFGGVEVFAGRELEIGKGFVEWVDGSLPKVKSIEISHSNLDISAIGHLARLKAWGRLEQLGIQDDFHQIHDEALGVLFGGRGEEGENQKGEKSGDWDEKKDANGNDENNQNHCGKMEKLSLTMTSITSLNAISQSPHLTNLKELNLSHSLLLNDDAIRLLCDGKQKMFIKLEHLNLSHCLLLLNYLPLLAHSPNFPNLKQLTLPRIYCDLDSLTNQTGLRSLREISIDFQHHCTSRRFYKQLSQAYLRFSSSQLASNLTHLSIAAMPCLDVIVKLFRNGKMGNLVHLAIDQALVSPLMGVESDLIEGDNNNNNDNNNNDNNNNNNNSNTMIQNQTQELINSAHSRHSHNNQDNNNSEHNFKGSSYQNNSTFIDYNQLYKDLLEETDHHCEISITLLEFFSSPSLSKLQFLSLDCSTIESTILLKYLAKSPYLTNLEMLSMRECNIIDEALVHLATSPFLFNLKKINLLGNNAITSNAIHRLLYSSPNLGNLKDIYHTISE